MTTDALTRNFEQAREQARQQEIETARARERNIEIFTTMFLSLGADAMKLDGTRHDAELAEAKALAAHRWNQLIAMEQQVVRDEQKLAGRPKKRPSAPGDDLVPDRTLAERDRAWESETKVRTESLAALKDQAKAERQELESYITKRR